MWAIPNIVTLVVLLWEQDSALLLATPALLPFAALARTNSPAALLQQIAADVIDMIEELDQKRNISACVELRARLILVRAIEDESTSDLGSATGQVSESQEPVTDIPKSPLGQRLREIRAKIVARSGDRMLQIVNTTLQCFASSFLR